MTLIFVRGQLFSFVAEIFYLSPLSGEQEEDAETIREVQKYLQLRVESPDLMSHMSDMSHMSHKPPPFCRGGEAWLDIGSLVSLGGMQMTTPCEATTIRHGL